MENLPAESACVVIWSGASATREVTARLTAPAAETDPAGAPDSERMTICSPAEKPLPENVTVFPAWTVPWETVEGGEGAGYASVAWAAPAPRVARVAAKVTAARVFFKRAVPSGDCLAVAR
jgi:hypothetical protein